jgi:4-amino-4-deoxy-L-arabinose transferase-like glycosyltransferase
MSSASFEVESGADGMHATRLRYFNLAGLVLAVAGAVLSLWVAVRYFERVPHIEDEMAYVWQARVIAESGKVTTPTPVCPDCFLVPFVVDYNGLRFGKYPLGWPVVLAIGEKFGARDLVNPLLAGFSVWLTYLLGRRIFTPFTGLLAAALMVVSPFFLMNSGSLLSHNWSLFLTLAFTLAWLDLFAGEQRVPRWMALWVAGLCLGCLALTRPLTAVGVAVPFGMHAAILIWRGNRAVRLHLLGFGLVAGGTAGLYFLWQYAVTGSALLNPYTLWWPYDKIGFGPGVGVNPAGNTLAKAVFHTRFSLGVGSHDLFGWPYLSYLVLPFGLFAGRRNIGVWLLLGTALGLVACYLLYWTPAWLYGPRYYFEGLPGAVVLTAAGLIWLAGKAGSVKAIPAGRWGGWPRARLWVVCVAAGILVAGNIFIYLPLRLQMMFGLYQVAAADLAPFLTAEARGMPPTLVIVHVQGDWIEYGRLLDLSSPLNTSQFIFIFSLGSEEDMRVARAFPDRQVWDYFPARVGPQGVDKNKR